MARRPVSFSESILRGSDGTCGCTPSTCWPVTEGRRTGPVSIQRVDRAGDDVSDGYVPGVVSAARPCPQCSLGPCERAYRAALDGTLHLSAAHRTLSPCAGGHTAERYTAQACRPTVRQARPGQHRNGRPFSPHPPTRGRRWRLIPIVSHDRRVSPQLRMPSRRPPLRNGSIRAVERVQRGQLEDIVEGRRGIDGKAILSICCFSARRGLLEG